MPARAWEALLGAPGDPRSPVALGTCQSLSAARGNQLKETLDLLYSSTSPFFLYPVTSLRLCAGSVPGNG